MRTSGLSKVHKSAYDKPLRLGANWPQDLLDFKLSLKDPLDLAPNKLLDFSSKNPANQGVLCLGRRVFALHEVMQLAEAHVNPPSSIQSPLPATMTAPCKPELLLLAAEPYPDDRCTIVLMPYQLFSFRIGRLASRSTWMAAPWTQSGHQTLREHWMALYRAAIRLSQAPMGCRGPSLGMREQRDRWCLCLQLLQHSSDSVPASSSHQAQACGLWGRTTGCGRRCLDLRARTERSREDQAHPPATGRRWLHSGHCGD